MTPLLFALVVGLCIYLLWLNRQNEDKIVELKRELRSEQSYSTKCTETLKAVAAERDQMIKFGQNNYEVLQEIAKIAAGQGINLNEEHTITLTKVK